MKTQTERAALVSEIEDLEELLAGLRARHEEMLVRYRNTGFGAPIAGSGEVRESITRAEYQLGILRDRLAQHDKIAAYRRDVAEAGTRAASAKQAAEDAEARADELEARIARLRLKVGTLQGESETAGRQAIEAEILASKDYARSIAEGDEGAAKIALQGLEKARSKASALKSKAGSDASIIAALTQEIEELERQATGALEEANNRRKAMYGAELVSLQAKWDEATEALLAIGRNIAQVADDGGYSTGLSGLHVPVFNPGRGYIGEGDIRGVE